MQFNQKLFNAAFVAIAMHGLAFAGDTGTATEAMAMVRKAGEYLKANGREKALAEFNNPKGSFRDRDLYIMVYDMNGVNLAHGANPKMVGKNLFELKDADGFYMVKSFVDTAKTKGNGWIDYKWPNPISKAIEPKSTYIERYDDILIGAGIYK